MRLLERITARHIFAVTEEPVAGQAQFEMNESTRTTTRKNETAADTLLESITAASVNTETPRGPTAENGAAANPKSAVKESNGASQNDSHDSPPAEGNEKLVADLQSYNSRDGSADGGGEEEDESHYPTGISLALLTFGLCMATFVVRASHE